MLPAVDDHSREYGRCQKQQEQNDHGPSARAMTEIPYRPRTYEITDVADGGDGPVDEIGEARTGRPYETPEYARDDQGAHHIAGPIREGLACLP
jgi:hypothetical protein